MKTPGSYSAVTAGVAATTARPAPGFRTPATGYLSNFRQDVRPLSTGGVLVPESG